MPLLTLAGGQAVLRLNGSTDLSRISIIKKTGGALQESYLDSGYLLEKKVGVGQPRRVEDAKILIANTAMDADRVKIFSTSVKTDDTAEVARIESAERERMFAKCKKIIDHGVNVFINRQLIYNLPEQFFADHKVAAVEHADFEGVERLALVLGGEVVSTFDHPELVKLGHADLMEEIMIGESKLVRFSGCAGGAACSIVLRGSSQHFLDEVRWVCPFFFFFSLFLGNDENVLGLQTRLQIIKTMQKSHYLIPRCCSVALSVCVAFALLTFFLFLKGGALDSRRAVCAVPDGGPVQDGAGRWLLGDVDG